MEIQVDKTLKMIDKIVNSITVDLNDEMQRQILSGYIFGVLNGLAHEESVSALDVKAIMIRIAIEKLNYETKVATELVDFLIESTRKEFHPTMNSIIHRGISAYYLYLEEKYDDIKKDFADIITVIKSS